MKLPFQAMLFDRLAQDPLVCLDNEIALSGNYLQGSRRCVLRLVEVDRDPIAEMCLTIDGYKQAESRRQCVAMSVASPVKIIEDLRPIPI